MWAWMRQPMNKLHGICLLVTAIGGIVYGNNNSRGYTDRRVEESTDLISEQIQEVDSNIRQVLEILRTKHAASLQIDGQHQSVIVLSVSESTVYQLLRQQLKNEWEKDVDARLRTAAH